MEAKAITRQRSLPLLLCMAVAGVLMSAAAPASADWKVSDDKAQNKLEDIKGKIDKTNDYLGNEDGKSINQRLKDLYEQQTFKNAKKSEVYKDNPKDEIQDYPTFTIDKDKPEGDAQKVELDKRCKSGDKICELIYNTEMAKYNYSVAVYKHITQKRIKELKEIQEERNNIGDEEQGKIQANTNRLMTLMAKMEVDKQQQQSAMYAFDARIRYLQTARDTLANAATNGPVNKTLTDMGSDALTGVALQAIFSSMDTVR
ncbi:hypothetical protein [Luteimonas aquatica]|uniref:hypothetical protein n=1 Tax=Luteimonas aquatica TaxID=450364 RepID=UPI001F59BFD5|nr:hypothetical protein [Luteimonas aquatica]